MNKINLYNKLQKNLETNPSNNKLDMFENLEESLKYENMEEGLINYMTSIELANISNIDKESAKAIKTSLGIKTIDEEKQFFLKIFMRDYESRYLEEYKLKKDINVSKIFKDFASPILKENKEFIKMILTLDGKYAEYMSQSIKEDKELIKLAITTDSTKEIISFINSSDNTRKDSKLAIEYFKRIKENNNFISASKTYETIFKKDNNDEFPKEKFSNDEQIEWLKDNMFLANLAILNRDFVKYITEGKISLTSNQEIKKKIL